MLFSLRSLARIRRVVSAGMFCLFMAALLVPVLGLFLLPLLGPTQAGMFLAASAAGGGAIFLIILAAHLVLALISGRTFCSWLCPLGTLQDFAVHGFARVSGKKPPRYRFAPGRMARYILPALLLGSLLWQGAWLYGLAEPYSLFARSVQSIGQPVYALGVNALAFLGEESGFFLLPRIPYKIDAAALGMAVPLLALVLALVWKGRGYCNSICPVGALLGVIGAHSWLRPRFTERCNACGLCETRCKARCLDPKAGILDSSRCVACYNCLEACLRQGLAMLPRARPYMPGRAFALRALGAGAGLALLSPLVRAVAEPLPPTTPAPPLPAAPARHSMPVLPPGAISLAHLESRCTGCHSCLDICPPGVLTASGPHAWEQRRFARMALPGMDFFRAFCQIGCTRCSEVCPSGALRPVSLEDKKRLQLGQAVFTKSLCIIVTGKTRCGACAEHCPTGALRMTPPEDGGMDLPRIDQSLCIGCGACQYACPVRPRQAVEVFALAVHARARAPEGKSGQNDIDAGGEFPF